MGDTEFKGQKMMSDIEFERQKIIIQHEYNIEKLKFESDEKRKDIRLHNLHEQNKSAENYSKEYGVIFTRSMILLNGGAIILSINSFINLSTKNTSLTISLFIDAFLCYLIGIICALIISIMGYFNFGYISQAYSNDINRFYSGSSDDKVEKNNYRYISWTRYIAIILGIISILFFISGSCSAIKGVGIK